MLSTSRIKLHNPYLLVALSILVLLVSAIVVYQSGVLPMISTGQPATQNLTTLSAANVSAYRWEAMAKFYAAQGARIPATGGNLTTLSNADISAYRWDAMARFYAGRAPAAVNLSWPSRPDFSRLNENTIIPITGIAEGLAIYHRSEWGMSAAVQSDLEIYYLSERNSPQAPAAQYGPPGR